MYWADELVKKISNKKKKHRVDDMKTVSGMPHVGSLRAVTTHDVIYKAMKDAGFNVEFTYVFNDMDPMDGLPVYLDEKKYKQHMGKPLYKIPSPEKGYESFGKYYAIKYKEAFNKIGCNPRIIWSHEVYAQGKMNDTIRVALDNANKIRKIYKKVAGQDKPKNWHPYQVICPKCGKVGSTIVTEWDGKLVTYECKKDLVKWAKGCGYKGKVEPINENGKLMWKVDWPAHWKVINVTVEGAGKEHFTEGGSRDIGVHICKEVFKTKPPFGFLHEFFLIGGSKMSSSKGTGIGADKITEIIPPYLVRFLIVKTHVRRAVDFDPVGMSIPDLFDAYDKAAKAYWKRNKKNKKDEKLSRIFELSQVDGKPPVEHRLPRFRDIAKYLQDSKRSHLLELIFSEEQDITLDKLEHKVLNERKRYAKIWLRDYAPQEFLFEFSKTIPDAVNTFSSKQIKYLEEVANLLDKEWKSTQDFQQALYDTSNKIGLTAKEAFKSIYIATLGKDHGPQAAWMLLKNTNLSIDRFMSLDKVKKEVVKHKIKSTKTNQIKLGSNFAKTYPSATIGFALIEGIKVKKINLQLEKEKTKFLQTISTLTTEEVGQYLEIQSYRKMFKKMGVNWHSRRPGPEALLRRFARKGDMPKINTCVDAYNLIVMKYKVSAGAFDADQMKTPVEVRITRGGEKALFIGDKEETILKPGEVCYFDQIGPYNMDYNYRDAIRTSVTEKTKNIWINTEGVYEITPKQVQQTLNETIKIIQKYCGGKVKEKGILLTS